ncbi:sensor domain-containing diguanylate cyclase [Stappia sp. MMSF_3263]|uniref:sensor domain-containing diguanylate cyclase n=1 Tax=Stappia sp. MMSF_3263 TaxID=3046693 RepID=UPI00273E1C45|nr:sensor domain-containing diguanylate cyclase [Stappia sp. MMSF_3263]
MQPATSGQTEGATQTAGDLIIELPVRFVHQLSAAETLDDVLDTVAQWSRVVFNADRATIALEDTPTHLKLIAMQGNNAIPIDMPVPIEGTMIGRVFTQRRPEICPDFSTSGDLDCAMLKAKGLQSCLDVPLVSGNQCFGTMNVGDVERHAFTQADMHRLEAMAHWVAASVRIHRQVERMAVLSDTDPLTGTYNRRAFGRIFAELIRERKPGSGTLGVALIDLDHFKEVNDTHGHEAGDSVLVRVGEILQDAVRKGDLVARMGGEEFCLVMDDIDREGLQAVLDDIITALRDTVLLGSGRPITVTASIGALLIEDGTADLGLLMRHADAAMYRAKEAGRDRIEFTQPGRPA